MAMRVRYGTPAVCVAMVPSEQRECVPTSSGANPSLAAPTRWVSALMMAVILEALTEWSPLEVGKLLTGVVGLHPIYCRGRKMLTPARTRQAAAESDLK